MDGFVLEERANHGGGNGKRVELKRARSTYVSEFIREGFYGQIDGASSIDLMWDLDVSVSHVALKRINPLRYVTSPQASRMNNTFTDPSC